VEGICFQETKVGGLFLGPTHLLLLT